MVKIKYTIHAIRHISFKVEGTILDNMNCNLQIICSQQVDLFILNHAFHWNDYKQMNKASYTHIHTHTHAPVNLHRDDLAVITRIEKAKIITNREKQYRVSWLRARDIIWISEGERCE